MKNSSKNQVGFTLIELMIVVAIIGVIASIAYPNYQRYVIKTKRTAMMTDLQNIGSQIQAQKLAKGSYGAVDLTSLTGDYPKQDNTKLYTVTASATPLTESWKIIATPITTAQMKDDGILSYDYQGIKCRINTCGKTNEWNP